ncbi:MAG: DNA starvation/stationary phase protection protein Dps [Anaerolineaceae bacterium]|nr:DNA starvation/stationary phase protection protein Dps [Anaerolineaceae bacterium]
MLNDHPRTFLTRNDLTGRVRESMVQLLNQQLADTLDLYSQVKQAHWNVKGMHFIQLHLLFDDLAASLIDFGDKIAERATSLGGMAMGTNRITAARSQLPEFPVDYVTGKQVVEVLAQRFGAYSSSTRAAIATAAEYEDPTTADLFTEISRTIDKNLWFLDAHLQE